VKAAAASPSAPEAVREITPPALRRAFVFSGKAAVFQVLRALADRSPLAPRPLPCSDIPPNLPVWAESRERLYRSEDPCEWALQAGKVHNLRLAARALHGRILPAGRIFSFWANVGRATKGRGFVLGRELREGCVIPAIGGGLCQLSGSLYELALRTGCEVVERHAHSRRLPGQTVIPQRDATIFWNYVDLRFKADRDLQLAVELSGEELVVRFLSRRPVSPGPAIPVPEFFPTSSGLPPAESCETCGVADCFRHPSATALPRARMAAWLLDRYQPEFDDWMKREHRVSDALLLPLASQSWRLGPYRWSRAGFSRVREFPLLVLRRSFVSRRLSAQGAARQIALLAMDRALARSFARSIPPLAQHLVISQNLLPFLWADGVLGGRTFDVLMERFPLAELERRLDKAARHHPESPTLADFRAPRDIVRAESSALAAARHWITPHSGVAALAGPRAVRLPWQIPSAPPVRPGRAIVFPSSTLGRKGAYTLRAVVRRNGWPIRLVGPVLERRDFWSGTDCAQADGDWLDGAAAVVLPAWVEHWPRRLLRAIAAGVPLVAGEGCGLEGISGVKSLPAGDESALEEALRGLLSRRD